MNPMKPLILLASLTLVLAACGKTVPADSVESLLANPERHKALRAQCKVEHDKVGDTVCNAVAEVTRRRFMGDGKTPYTTDPSPSLSSPSSASSSSASAAKD
jgi:hypothetical protein